MGVVLPLSTDVTGAPDPPSHSRSDFGSLVSPWLPNNAFLPPPQKAKDSFPHEEVSLHMKKPKIKKKNTFKSLI